MVLALPGLMGAFEEIQVCISSSRKNRRWYSGTDQKAKEERVVKPYRQSLRWDKPVGCP